MKRGKKIHVLRAGDQWAIIQEGTLKPLRIVKKARTAVEYARKRASKENADVKWHGNILGIVSNQISVENVETGDWSIE